MNKEQSKYFLGTMGGIGLTMGALVNVLGLFSGILCAVGMGVSFGFIVRLINTKQDKRTD